MKFFLVCVVIKVVITVGESNEVKLNHTNKEGSGVKRFTYAIIRNNTNLKHSDSGTHNVKQSNFVHKSNFENLFKLNGKASNSTRVKYIKIVRYVPVRVEVTGREAKDKNVKAEANQNEVHINDKALKSKSIVLSNLIAKYLISKNGKENNRVQDEKENYKLDLNEFIQYLHSLGIEESEILKYEEILQRNAMGSQETLNQQHNSLTRKQNEYKRVIPLNYDLTGVKEVGMDALNVKVENKETEQEKVKLNDYSNFELKNLGKTQVMEIPSKGNVITTQQEENPKLLFDVVTEDQVILPNNSNAEEQQRNLEVIDVKELQPSNLLKAKELNGTVDLTEPKSQLVGNKEILLQDEEKNGNITDDIDFYDYQEKMTSDAVNNYNKSRNDNLMNTNDKYTKTEVGDNGSEEDGLLDKETKNRLYNQYIKTNNVDIDDPSSEKPNLTSIFDVKFPAYLNSNNERRNTEINIETSKNIENTKKVNVNSGLSELRNVLSEILITSKRIFKELNKSVGKETKVLKLVEKINHVNLNGLQNLNKFIRILEDKDFDSVATKPQYNDRLITNEDNINEVLTNAVKALVNNGVSNYEVKHIVKQSLLNVITSITNRRVKECQENVWSEVKYDLQLALYRNMLAFTVNSGIDTQI